MRKLLIIISCIILSGCSTNINNTPQKKTEEFLNAYIQLEEDVNRDIDNLVDNDTRFDEESKKEYKEIIKKQYKNMQYEIKDITEDGDEATVTTKIIVTDYTKTLKNTTKYKQDNITEFYEEGIYNPKKYTKYLIDELKKTKEKVTYTLEIKLHKKDKKWVVDSITNEIEEKILGIYNYE